MNLTLVLCVECSRGLGLKSLQRPCFESVFARWRTFGKWLNHKDSNSIYRLTHWWLPNLVALLGDDGSSKWGLVEGTGLWSMPLRSSFCFYYLRLFFSASQLPGSEQLCCTISSTLRFVFPETQSIEPASHVLKSQDPWDKINLSCSADFLWYFLTMPEW